MTDRTHSETVGLRIGTVSAPRADSAVARLHGLRTTDLSDASRKNGVMAGIRSLAAVPATSIVGIAVTVSAPLGGFDIVKLGLQLCRPGDVLVINVQGQVGTAVWGGNLSRGAVNRGVAAVVVDGAVRDLTEIDSLGLPVFARAACVSAAPVELPVGEVNVPIACGGTVVFPGDLIVGDSDGVVVIRPADLPGVLSAHAAVLAGHRQVRSVLDRGQVTSIDRIVQRLEAAGMSIPAALRTDFPSEVPS